MVVMADRPGSWSPHVETPVPARPEPPAPAPATAAAAIERYPAGAYPPLVRVSTVISAFDRSRFVLEALDSVLAQDCPCVVETVVVDDGSSDGSADLVARWAAGHSTQDRPLTLVRRPHEGIAATVAAGVAVAQGEFVSHLSSDDQWTSDRVSRVLELEEELGRNATVYGNWTLVSERGDVVEPDGFAVQRVPRPPRVLWEGPDTGGDAFESWWRYRLVLGGSLLFMPTRFLQGRWALPPEASEEDFWFSLVAFLQGPIVWLDHPTYLARQHSGQETRRRLQGEAGNETQQVSLLDAQIALLQAVAPVQRRLAVALRLQRELVLARVVRDRGSLFGWVPHMLKAATKLVTVPVAAGLVARRLAYCLFPGVARWAKSRRPT
jgi:hypothetical protein